MRCRSSMLSIGRCTLDVKTFGMSENDGQTMDIELFIGEVKKYPEIWNITTEDYHDRLKKRSAWMNICCIFYDEFDKENDRTKNEMCNKLIKKWKHIKDNYNRYCKRKRSRQAADSGRQYIYARQLSFLQQCVVETETQSSKEREEIEETPESKYLWTPLYEQRSRKRKLDVESPIIEFLEAPSPVPAPVLEYNGDRSFFESLLPLMSDFTTDLTLEFRCEVLNLVKRLRLSLQSGTQRNTNLQQNPGNNGHQDEPSNSTSHCSTNQTQPPQSSTEVSEIGTHSHSETLPKARSPDLQADSLGSSSSANSETQSNPDADCLNIYMEGKENK